ncbi:retrovirus-related pol polyprotein from transposon TNT 1-94, partial [Tanacetum coccineum]
FRVFNNRTRIVEENLHVQFSENTPNITGSRPNWLFTIDALTKSMNYKPFVTGNQSNGNAGIKACNDTGDDEKKVSEKIRKEGGDPSKEDERDDQEKDASVNNTNNVNAASTNEVNAVGRKASIKLPDDPNMPALKDIVYLDDDEDVGAKEGKSQAEFLVVTDDYSRFSWVFFLATKVETSGILKSFINRVENLIDQRVKLPTTFWAEAVNTACYVQNRVLVTKPHNKAPYDIFLGRKLALGFIRPFGCPVTILNTIDHLGNFKGKADEGFFVRYSINSKAFRVFNSRTRIVEENLHVQFSENTPNIAGSGPNWLFDIDALTKSMNYKPVVTGNQSNGNAGIKACDDAGDDEKKVTEEPGKEGGDPKADMNNLDTTIQVSHIPTTRIHKDQPLDQVIGDLHTATQTRNMSKNLEDYGFVVELPNRKRAIGTKWVFRNKKEEKGIVIKNKARLVAHGYTQEEGIDYDEVFTPVARIEEKALYGLHQAPRAWYEILSTYLLDNRFQRGKIGKTLFIRRHKGDIMLVQVYVDDIIFSSTKKSLCTEFEKIMHKKFQMSSMGDLTFSLDEVKQKVDKDGEEVDVYLYRLMIGSLMYLTSSRPDIMFVVCACARYQINPKVSLLHALKRIFRYLKGQPKLGLWYPKDLPFDLVTYTDSDYAGASLDRKSTTGGKAKKSVRLMMEKLFGMELELILPSGPITNVADEAINEEMDDSLERTATTATGLEAEQDSGNIDKTQSKATLNKPSSSGTSSGSGPRRQETMGDTIASE